MKKLVYLFILAATLCGSASVSAQTFNENYVVRTSGYEYYYDEFPYELITRKLTASDLYGLNRAELRILRNAIYAYHGYIFKSADLKRYFSQFSWYNPRYKSEAKVYGMFSKIEKYNVEFIKKFE